MSLISESAIVYRAKNGQPVVAEPRQPIFDPLTMAQAIGLQPVFLAHPNATHDPLAVLTFKAR